MRSFACFFSFFTTLLSLSLFSFSASGAEPVLYGASIRPKATDYQGHSFDHPFLLEATLETDSLATGAARASERIQCDHDALDQPENCRTVCVSSVEIPVGKLTLKVAEVKTGSIRQKAHLLIAQASSVQDGPCSSEPGPLEGKQVVIQDVSFFGDQNGFAFSEDPWHLVELYFPQTSAPVELLAIGRNEYQISQWSPKSGISAHYTYYETATWAVSGPVLFKAQSGPVSSPYLSR